LKEEAVRLGFVTPAQFDRLVQPDKMTRTRLITARLKTAERRIVRIVISHNAERLAISYRHCAGARQSAKSSRPPGG
jgi:hypothetical protein